MPHFAKINGSNIVEKVEVFSQDDIDANGGDYSSGAESWVNSYRGGTWKQCSYNANQRNIYPSIGDSWDSANNKFKAKKPAASCTFNSTSYQWEYPVARPSNEYFMEGETKICKMIPYDWDDDNQKWIKTNGAIKVSDGTIDTRNFEWNGSAWVVSS